MAKKLSKVIKKPQVLPESERIKKTRIRVIGIGGGGNSIVSEIASKIEKSTFVAVNTDLQALKEVSRKVVRFQFGENLTHGLGTGMNVGLAEIAAQNEKERIRKLLEGQDLLIIIACLGGGSGSGATPVFAKISRSLGNLTYGIFTLPFKFEGERKMEIARNSLEKIRPYLNALSIIPNERIFQIIDKTTPLKGALSAINKTLAESLEGLIETIYRPGLINIDFADLKTILTGRGRLAYLNTVSVPQKEGASQETIEKLLNSPLYPYTIRGAKAVLFNIAGEKSLGLGEVNQISKTISELLNKEAKIIFGISQNKKDGEIVKTTLLATGCGLKIFSDKVPKKRKKKKIIPKLAKPSPVISPQPPPVKKQSLEPSGPLAPTGQKPKKKIKIKKTKKPKRRKIKIEVSQPEIKTPPAKEVAPIVSIEEKVRKNALQLKKEAEELEKKMIEQEQFWETPAFLRRKRITQ